MEIVGGCTAWSDDSWCQCVCVCVCVQCDCVCVSVNVSVSVSVKKRHNVPLMRKSLSVVFEIFTPTRGSAIVSSQT